MKKTIVRIAIGAAALALLILIYTSAIKGECPICDGHLEYVGKVVKETASGGVGTYYRYQCDKHFLHFFDLIVKVR